MKIDEDQLSRWVKGPGTTEQEKCDNAVSVITGMLNSDQELAKYNVKVFSQGSYRNRTNVKQDSDVDVCVMLRDTFFVYYPEGITQEMAENVDSTYKFSTFKNSIENALVCKFGRDKVKRGNKAFDIHANSYRIDADVIPTFEYRSYTGERDHLGRYTFHTGVKFITDKGQLIINWPDQTYNNGVARHSTTKKRYKRCIRILKHLRNQMQEEGIQGSQNVSSFLIECLVWNTPLKAFEREEYFDMIRWILAHTCNNTRTEKDCKEWGEVNEMKYLFRSWQPWTMGQANKFLNSAWHYIGYK